MIVKQFIKKSMIDTILFYDNILRINKEVFDCDDHEAVFISFNNQMNNESPYVYLCYETEICYETEL